MIIFINDIPDDLNPIVGAVYNVEITEAFDYDLVGRIKEDPSILV